MILGVLMSVNTLMAKPSDIAMQNDLLNYIGKPYTQVQNELKDIVDLQMIKTEDRVSDFFITNPNIAINGIAIGDSEEKIKRIYPKEWVSEQANRIVVLQGSASHYGIATKYIAYITQQNKVTEIQVGYTADFMQSPLLESNQLAYKSLQGKWRSELGRVITFKDKVMQDEIMQAVCDHQEYILLSPNEMRIYTYTKNNVSTNDLRFWIVEDNLYLFKVNPMGIPIKETVEKFVKDSI